MQTNRSVKETILIEFLKNPALGPREMSAHLNEKYNTVKAAYAKLAEEGYLERRGRGNYRPNIPFTLITLMNKVSDLEKRVAALERGV